MRQITQTAFAAGLVLLTGVVLAHPLCAQELTSDATASGLIGQPPLPESFDGPQYGVSRWVDPYGRGPVNYEEWKSGRAAPGPFQCQLVSSPGTKTDREPGSRFAIIVNSDIYDALSASIELYALDVAGEGFNVEVYSSSGGTPAELRGFLQGLYGSGLEGCVFIGDLPVAWYEMYGCYDPPYQEEFPCDLFYTDMNGVFEDTDADDLYDLHTGDRAPDIWLGRLTASPLTFGGSTEIELLENYFRKNHRYRCHLAPLANRGLAYNDDNCAFLTYHLNILMTEFIGGCTAVDDPWTTWDTDYENRLTVPHELVQVWAHSSPASHAFGNPAQQWSFTENWEIRAIDPVAYFYILCACSNARYTSADYMAGWYVFSRNHGLAAFGSTKTGCQIYFHDFYPSLGRQEPIGRAYLNWFSAQAAGGFWRWEECYYYGLTLVGDPTLRIQEKSDSRMIQYDNEWGGSSFCLPNDYGLDLFNTRFTAVRSCSLSAVLMLANPWNGAPNCRIYIWNSNGTFPTTVIDSIDVQLDPVNIGRWTTVDVSELGLRFSEGEDFHVGFTGVNLQPGERIDVHSGVWVDSLPVRSSLRQNGSWVMFHDLVPEGQNFDIRVIVVEEPQPKIEITTLTIPHANVDGDYFQTLQATGGMLPYSWDLTAGSLPSSIALDPQMGTISGQASAVDTAHFTVRVTDNSVPALTDIQHLTLITQICVDSDGDGFGDPGHSGNGCSDDNCPAVYNPGQEDSDGDGIGDACCCVVRVGDANQSGEDEPTISDISVMIDARFISGTCTGVIGCPAEADINQSGGVAPACDEITISDISILIDYLFITGSSLGLPNCL